MIQITGLNIRVSRGDYFPLRIDLTDIDGNPYVLQPGDVLTFAVRDASFTTVSGGEAGKSYVDIIVPTLFSPQTYDYDISIKFADEKVRTLMWAAKFTVERTARR